MNNSLTKSYILKRRINHETIKLQLLNLNNLIGKIYELLEIFFLKL